MEYKIGKKLGSGGQGTVYSAVNKTGQEVAIKVLKYSKEALPKINTEVNALKKLKCHPGILCIKDTFTKGNKFYIVTELLEGKDLFDVIHNSEPLDYQTKVNLSKQIISAVVYAHRHGIIHKDIKPENIMVSPDLKVTIFDFGMACLKGICSLSGTPDYTADELVPKAIHRYVEHRSVNVSKPALKKADAWAVGMVLYELFGNNRTSCEGAVLKKRLCILNDIKNNIFRSNTGTPMDNVINRLLEKNPRKRITLPTALKLI